MKNKFFGLITILSMVFGITFLSCEIGLGDAVDTMKPEVEFTSPTPNVGAIVRDTFAIAGSWSDDGQIQSAKIKLERKNNDFSKIYDFKCDIKDDKWRYVIDPVKENIIDGQYEATVSFIDGAQHETKITRTFIVDNKAPIVVLQRPYSTEKTNNDLDSYGQKISLEGMAADDNSVGLIEVDFYEENAVIGTNKPIYTKTLKNVPLSINEAVARFEENIKTDYSEIYGSTSSVGAKNKTLKCTIRAYDKAKKYPIDGSPIDEKGNVTSTYYLYKNPTLPNEDQLANVLFDTPVNVVYQMINGIYENTHQGDKQKIIEIKGILKKNEITESKFIINPDNSPRYSLQNFEQLVEADDFSISKYKKVGSKGDSITFLVEPGLDKFPIDNKSITVTATPVERKLTSEGKLVKKTEGVVKFTQEPDANGKLGMKVENTNGDLVNVTLYITEDKNRLVGGVDYLFELEGKDTKNHNIAKKGPGLGYGFYYTIAGEASGCTLNDIAEAYTKGNDIHVTGTLDYNAQTQLDLVKVAQKAKIEIKLNGKIVNLTNKPTLTFKDEHNFEIPIKNFNIGDKSGNAKITVTLEDGEQGLAASAYSLTFKYDVEKPTIRADLVNGQVISENKIASLTGSASDKSTRPVYAYYKLTKADGSVLTNEKEAEANLPKITDGAWEIKNLELGNEEGNLTLEVWTKDIVGNISDRNTINFIYDTAAPAVEITEKPEAPMNVTDVTIKGTVTETNDLDKDKSVVVNIDGTENIINNLNKSDNFAWSYTIKDIKAGKHTVTVYANDMAGKKSEETQFTFIIDNDIPEAKINQITDADLSSLDTVDVNKTLKVTGTLSDNTGIASAELQYSTSEVNKDTEESDKNWTKCGDINTTEYNWTSDVDTTKLTDNTKYYLRVFAKDTAGNTLRSTPVEIFVNQNSDRPLITFNDIALESMTNNTFAQIQKKQLGGTIIDDDGIKSFQYKEGSEAKDYNEVPYKNGSWSLILEEGKKDIFFKITDNNGDVWESGATRSDEFTLRLRGSNDTKDSSYDRLNAIIDIQAPSLKEAKSVNITNSTITLGGELTDTIADSVGWPTSAIIIYDSYLSGETSKSKTDEIKVDFKQNQKTWEHVISNPVEGEHQIRIVAKDSVGNQSEANRTITVDKTAPTANISLFKGTTEIKENPGTALWFNKNQIKIKVSNIVENGTGVSIVSAKESTATEFVTLSYDKEKNEANGVITLKEGTNDVIISLIDRANNEKQITLTNIKVDTKSPEIQNITVDSKEMALAQSQSYNKLVSGVDGISKDLSITVNASEIGEQNQNSGIKSVVLKTINDLVLGLSPVVTSGSYAFTVPKTKFITDIKNKTGKVVFELEDNAGNKTTVTGFNLTIDKEGPTSQIGNINDADISTPNVTDVNKTIVITGTVKDDNITLITEGDKAPELQYSLNNTDSWTKVPNSTVNVVDSNWNVSIDTTKIQSTNETKEVYFRFQSYDEAGNPGISESKKVLINQDTDRPTITFTNHIIGNILSSKTLLGSLFDDDGAVSSFLYSKDGGSTWENTPITVSNNGTWSLDLSEGVNNLAFKVIEKGEKTTWEDSKLKSSNGELSEETKLNVTVDTTAPIVSKVEYFVGGSETALKTEIKDEVLGGTKKKTLKMQINASDTPNTLPENAVVVTLDGENQTVTKTPEGIYEVELILIGTGFKQLQYTVTDAAGLSTTSSVQLNVDNTAPKVFFTDPQSSAAENKYLAGNITARGSVDSPKTNLKYVITLSETQPETFENNLTDSQTSWTLKFDQTNPSTEGGVTQDEANAGEDAATTKHTKPIINWLKELVDVRDNSNIDLTTYSKIETIYLWIKAEDEVGNVSYSKHAMVVDPQGDRPEIIVSNPPITTENPIASASGSLSFFGSIVDTIGVNLGGKNVYMQLISDGYRELLNHNNNNKAQPDYCNDTNDKNIVTPPVENFTLTKADMLFMKEAFPKDKLVNMRTGEEWDESVDSALYSNYGIEISVAENGTWNKEINANDKFNAKDIGETKKNINVVGARFFAKDNDNKISESSIVNVKFDSSKPKISGLKLVNGDKTISYTPNMYINGKTGWNLVGTVTDNDKVASIRIKNMDVEGEPTQLIKTEQDKQAEVTFEFNLDVLTNKKAGGINLLIDACDATSGRNTIEQVLSINVDNLAPVISYKGEKGYAIVPEENGKNIIRQKNSFFTFGSRVTEEAVGTASQSGFAYVAAYFKRDNSIINPLLTRDNNSIDTGYTLEKDGLYWTAARVASNITKNENGTCTFNVTTVDSNIHANGLVKINNVYYLIDNTYKNGETSVTIEGIPASDTFDVQFANAFIINNPIQESGRTGAIIQSDGYYLGPSEGNSKGDVVNDDGDRMIEVASKTGARWDWEASICSKNIPDGEIELHYVVFDKAGNYTIGTDTKPADVNNVANTAHVGAYVKNNSPRIAGFLLEIGGKTFDSNSIKLAANRDKYITSNPESGTPTFDWDERVYNSVNKEPIPTSRTFGSKLEEVATLGDQTTITPEIVGGNGEIYYKFEIGESGTEKTTWSATNATKQLTSGTIDYTVSNSGKLVLQKGDLYKIGKTITDPGNNAIPFKFTFADTTYKQGGYDSVESRFTDENSQKADMTIYFKLKGVGAAPVVTINDFYWNSMYDNSIYEEDTKNGHIELPESWKNVNKEQVSIKDIAGLIDNDAKVSGKIKIEGTVTCDSGIGSIYYTLPGVAEQTVTDLSQSTNKPTLSGNYSFYITESKASDGTVVTADDKEKVTPTNIKWTLLWNTESVDTTHKVGLNKIISVKAKNKGIPHCPELKVGETSQWLSIDGKTYYGAEEFDTENAKTCEPVTKNVDVVPYITGFEKVDPTTKKKILDYGRTKSGAFALARNDSGLKFSGFNIPGGDITSAKLTNGNKSYPVTITDGICTIPEYAKSGNFEVAVSDGKNKIPAMNSVNDNNASYNREFAGYDPIFRIADFSDDRYVHVWRISEDDVFQGSKDCSIPTMTVDPTDGTLYAAFSNGGFGSIFTSSVFASEESPLVQGSVDNAASNGDDTTPSGAIDGLRRAYSYNFAPSNIDIDVPGTSHNNRKDVSLAYGAVYRHADDKTWETITSYEAATSGGMYIYDNQDYTTQSFLNGNKPTRAHRGQLYSYNHFMDQFQNMKTVRKGDYIYSAYYDKYNKSINFTSVRASRGGDFTTSKLGNAPSGTHNHAYPWISIDGGKMPELKRSRDTAKWVIDDKGTTVTQGNGPADYLPMKRDSCPMIGDNNTSAKVSVEVGTPFNLDHPSNGTRANETGEYLGLALTLNGCPVIVYTANDKIKIASSSSVSGTLGYLKQAASYEVWGDIEKKPMKMMSAEEINSAYDLDGSKRSLMWNVQTLDLPTTYGVPSGYIDCAIDKTGYLHIAYKTKAGYLVYVKSTNAPSTLNNEGAEIDKTEKVDDLRPATYSFGEPVLVDKGGNDISIELDANNNPYISYIVTAEALDGMKIAFPYDVNGDKDTNALDEFETMTVPSNVVVKASKACIAPGAKASDFGTTVKIDDTQTITVGKYKAAVGVFCGTDYRSMFYVGE